MSDRVRVAIRQGIVEDVDQIALHRRLIFASIRDYPADSLAAMEITYREWVGERMQRGEYIAWFAVNDAGEVVAGAGVWLREWPISPRNLTGRDAHVLDVYVQPDYRGKGVGRTLMLTLVDWCKTQGLVTITLEASDDGRPLYDQLGFEPMDILRKRLS